MKIDTAFFCRTLAIAFLLTTGLADAKDAERPPERYGLSTLGEKRVDNGGDGSPELYGVRNFRVVLAGTLYRGGANNVKNREGKRANQNPLPEIGLMNLCREGFGNAVYLYATNFDSAPKKVECSERATGKPHSLEYLQMSPYSKPQLRRFLELVHTRIKAAGRPIYAHCWNGWHASGLLSAYALRQFCGLTGDEAVRYWDENTDGNTANPNFAKLRKEIAGFKPDPALAITAAEKARLCLPSKR